MKLLLAVACSDPAGRDPGDIGAVEWVPKPRTEEPATVIDCQGGERGRLDVRRSNTVVRNCTINGDVRVWGLVRNLNDGALRESSRTLGHVQYLRDNAPSHVVIEDCTIRGTTTVPLFVSPGVTFLTVRRTRIEGSSLSTMVYLSAESHGTTLEYVEVDARLADREAVAIDASDGNVLRDVHIVHRSQGGVYLYRNCGESGVARHTTPSDNRIEGTILGGGVAVWLGSREGNRMYCGEDRDGGYGSSVSNYDHARRNTVRITSDGEVRRGKTALQNTVEHTLP